MIIHVHSVFAQIYNSTPEEYMICNDILSAQPDGYQFTQKYKTGMWDGYIRVMDNQGRFPSGLCGYLIRTLKEQHPYIKVTVNVKYEIPEFLDLYAEFGDFVLRDYQLDAVEKILDNHRGVLHMATNAGKTLVAASIIASTGFKAIVIVPGRALLEQTASDLENFLRRKIGKFGNGHASFEDITVTTMMSAKKLANHDLTENIAVIADECHRVKSDTLYNAMLLIPGIVRVGMSGTPLTYNRLLDMKLIGATGDVVFKVTNSELIEAGYSSKAHVYMHTMNNMNEGGSYQHVHKATIVFNEERNDTIADLAINESDKPVLIMTDWVMHAEQILDRLQGHSVRMVTGATDTESMNLAMDELGSKYDILIATPVFNEGINIPAIKTLILTFGGKSHIQLLQRIGRGLRIHGDSDKLTIHDFFDKTSKYGRRHSKVRKDLYESEGFAVEIKK